jgi:hypothetical protein
MAGVPNLKEQEHVNEPTAPEVDYQVNEGAGEEEMESQTKEKGGRGKKG